MHFCTCTETAIQGEAERLVDFFSASDHDDLQPLCMSNEQLLEFICFEDFCVFCM